MKKVTLFVLLFALPALGFAQGIRLKATEGKTYGYLMTMSMDMVQSFGGQDIPMNSKGDGDIELQATKIQKNAMEWSYGSPKFHLISDNPMKPGTKMDTIIRFPIQKFTTDERGVITRMLPPSEEVNHQLGMMAAMQGMSK